jgi:hypothetical protein
MTQEQMTAPGAAYFFWNEFREIARSEGVVSADDLTHRLLPSMCTELLYPDPQNVLRVKEAHLKSKGSASLGQ